MNDAYVMKTIEHDGVVTRYLDSEGAPGRPCVLLVHDGWFGSDAQTLWAPLVPHLAGSARVVAPDMLGFGGTSKLVYFDRPMYQYRAAHLASFLRAVCEPGTETHAVGTSLGGSVLVRDAAASAPLLDLSSVVSISGSGGPWRSSFGAAELARFDGERADVERVLGHLTDDFPGYAEVLETRYENSKIPGHAESLLAARVKHPTETRAPQAVPWPEALEHVSVPITFVAGTRDPLLEPHWEEHLVGVGDQVEVRALDAKHAPSLDHPEWVAAIVQETIERAASRAHKQKASEVS